MSGPSFPRYMDIHNLQNIKDSPGLEDVDFQDLVLSFLSHSAAIEFMKELSNGIKVIPNIQHNKDKDSVTTGINQILKDMQGFSEGNWKDIAEFVGSNKDHFIQDAFKNQPKYVQNPDAFYDEYNKLENRQTPDPIKYRGRFLRYTPKIIKFNLDVSGSNHDFVKKLFATILLDNHKYPIPSVKPNKSPKTEQADPTADQIINSSTYTSQWIETEIFPDKVIRSLNTSYGSNMKSEEVKFGKGAELYSHSLPKTYKTIFDNLTEEKAKPLLDHRIDIKKNDDIDTEVLQLWYLLFCCEVKKNPAALIHHNMMLDLCVGGDWQWKNLADSDDPKAPMLGKEILIKAMRLNALYFEYLNHKYQENECLKEDPRNLIKKEAQLVREWFQKFNTNKDILNISDENFDEKCKDIWKILIEKLKEWSGFTPGDDVMDENGEAEVQNNPRSSSKRDPLKNLEQLRKYIDDFKNKFDKKSNTIKNMLKKIEKDFFDTNVDPQKDVMIDELEEMKNRLVELESFIKSQREPNQMDN